MTFREVQSPIFTAKDKADADRQNQLALADSLITLFENYFNRMIPLTEKQKQELQEDVIATIEIHGFKQPEHTRGCV